MWDSLVSLASYENTEALTIFLELLQSHIPCNHCRSSIGTFFKEHPISSCKRNALLYVWNMRDTVNRKLRRSMISYSIFCKRKQFHRLDLPQNVLHMLAFIHVHSQREKETGALERLCTCFDSVCSLLSESDDTWKRVRSETSSMHVRDALERALRIIISPSCKLEDYEIAFVEAPPERRTAPRKRGRHI